MENTLEEITRFADGAHGEQTRKYTPDRYIVHPVRVMKICWEYTDDVSILAAALLHDVLEDTPVQKDEITHFLSSLLTPAEAERTVSLVVDLTDVYTKENYPQWNRRKRKQKEAERLAATHPDAQTVKYADIIDNSVEIVDHDLDFAGVFLHEVASILEKINKGEPQLYQRAVDTVQSAILRWKNKKK